MGGPGSGSGMEEMGRQRMGVFAFGKRMELVSLRYSMFPSRTGQIRGGRAARS